MYRNLAFGRPLDSLDVLLIDENRGMRALLTVVLKSNGVTRIRSDGDSSNVLPGMLEMTPDVVIIQWNLEESDAETLIRSMRAEAMRPLCFVPVIVLSVQVSRGVIAAAVEAGASSVVRTPVSPRTLVDRLNWITNDTRCFYNDRGTYVLQSTGRVARAADADPGHGLLDLKTIVNHV